MYLDWLESAVHCCRTNTDFRRRTFPRFPPRPSDAERGGGAVADKIPAPGHCSLSLYTTLAILTSRSIQNYFR